MMQFSRRFQTFNWCCSWHLRKNQTCNHSESSKNQIFQGNMSDIKVPSFHGHQNWEFTLSKKHKSLVGLSIHTVCSGAAESLGGVLSKWMERVNPASIYLLKVNNRNIRKRCEICSKLTIKRLVSSLLTLNIFHTFL